MLASAATTANARFAPHNLCKQPDIVSRPREVMPMATVVAKYYVARLQILRQGNARPLLPNASVNSAEEAPLSEQMQEPLLEKTYSECLFKQSGIWQFAAAQRRFHWSPKIDDPRLGIRTKFSIR
jgi:hypothetical protein